MATTPTKLATYLLAAILAGGLASPAWTCQVPVFRYALENWEPDPLTVAVLYDGGDSSDLQPWLTRIDSASGGDTPANLRLVSVDVAQTHPPGSLEARLVENHRGLELPHLLVYFPSRVTAEQLAWSTALTEPRIDQLIKSPARELLVSRLLDGHSGVWVLLKSGNAEADAEAERVLRESLSRQPNEIQLPSLTDLATEEKFDADLGVELRVEFSLLAIEANDVAEEGFRQMLLHTEPDLVELMQQPIAIPVFGRGRTHYALVGAGITPENVSDSCRFICGACSCEVKWQNPGQDLLLAANWNQVQPGNWVNETPLPELSGMGDFAALASGLESTESKDRDQPMPELVASLAPHVARSEGQVASANMDPSATISTSEATHDGGSGPNQSTTAKVVAPSAPTGIDVNLVLYVWLGVLFTVGVAFTVWHRSTVREL